MGLAATKPVSDIFAVMGEYQDWLVAQVVPKWQMNGFTSNGAAIERFLADGQADLSCNKRIRVQARQMFAFAYAQKQGWIQHAPELIQRIESYLNQFTQNSKPGFYPHVLDAQDNILHAHRDLYDCAFFLLAYAWRYHVLHDLKALQHAENLVSEIEHKLKGSGSGWHEDTQHTVIRRQNPHMHLFEAFLSLYQFTQHSKWLAYAGEMFSLFENVFYDHGLLREYFTDSWQPHPQQGDIVEPGHMLEWVWLLQQYHKYTGKPVAHYCETLYANALKLGLHMNQPLLLDEVSPQGNIIKASKRCWPMTEWIKAALAMAKTHSQPRDYTADACIAIRSLLSHFKNTLVPDQYIDRLGPDNQVIEASAPASTLYHLLMAHAEMQNYAGTNI